jgi:hypothetical protein
VTPQPRLEQKDEGEQNPERAGQAAHGIASTPNI